MELCIGTVQFGLDYGICGQKKPSVSDAVRYLDYAVQNSITAIDTAAAYGSAEHVVGEFLKKKTVPRNKLFLSTKLFPNILDGVGPEHYVSVIRNSLKCSLRSLRTDYVDAYLFHSAGYAFYPQMLEALGAVKKEGLAVKTGVSVYEPQEALACMTDSHVDMIQAPYSIFDYRMKEAGVFARLADVCGIHTRSAFIQGLIMMREEQVPTFLEKARPVLRTLDRICLETGYSRVELAMAYVKRESAVSHLVFGVDNLQQLKEDVAAFYKEIPGEITTRMEQEFRGLDADLVMPSLWKNRKEAGK